ncbi:hypothetical protein IC762_12785 [Bradyrhizobium genosp. L]|uniref:hypothetical protein n=1 Tax=Bradyrhizobium genosp. L TaxID=83637 RepID=UPI0018A30757|nr:hypothetical protein [Bradyrhizobium genosp. L]QPF87113.1 hypothetical protein IC762_12785 [Bradyrhizobium genosp. L]
MIDDAAVLMLFAISIINAFGVVIALRKNSLSYTAIFYFNTTFFVFAPLQQLYLAFDPIFNNAEVMHTALALVLMWCTLSMIFLIRSQDGGNSREFWRTQSLPFNPLVLWIFSITASAVGITIYGSNLFSSRELASKAMAERFDLSISLLLTGCIFPFSFYSALVGLRLAYLRNHVHWRFLFLVAMVMSLMLNNVTVLSRYQVAAFAFAGLFFWLGVRPWSSRLLLVTLLAGTFASPLFHVFRSTQGTTGSLDYETFFSAMDYDAFSMLCHTILHVDHSGTTYGANILSAVFFFVPRGVWADKLQATPFYLMDTLSFYRGLWSFNLSEPLIAEGYFALGWAGAVAVSAIFLMLVNRLESASRGSFSTLLLFGCAFPIIALMVLRGSLIVGVSIVIGHLIAVKMAIVLSQLRASR